MTLWILLFVIAFFSGLTAQKASGSQSTSGKTVLICVAVLFALLFFGYVIGKDLAIRDNHRSTSATRVGVAELLKSVQAFNYCLSIPLRTNQKHGP